jgi:hypothetical protein
VAQRPSGEPPVALGAHSVGHARVGNIGDGQKRFALLGIQFADAFIGLLDDIRNLFHFGDQSIRAVLLFLETSNLIAGFVALRFALFVFGDELAAFFIQGLESLEVQRDIAPSGHIGEQIQVLAKKVQIMHVGRIA